jgi:hypothetical protein
MPTRIFLLSESSFDKSALAHKYFDWVKNIEGKVVENKRSKVEKGILKESVQRNVYPWTTFIFMQVVDDKNRDTDEETIKRLTRFPTAISDAIIYSVKVSAEKPEHFVVRAKQEFQAQKKLDYADIHALRYLVITSSDWINQENPEIALAEFIEYAKSQGINKVFFDDGKNGKNLDELFDEIDTVPQEPNIISSFLGYILFAILGTASYFLFYNPVTAFLIACEETSWNNTTNIIVSLLVLVLFPIWYPFVPVVESLLLNPGGYRGVLSSLETPYYNIRNLLSDHFRSAIVSIIIIGLIVAAVSLTLGVFGPAIIGGVGLTALAVNGATSVAAYVGISGLTIGGISTVSNVGLAAIAGTVVGIASTVFYYIGLGIVDAINACKNYISAPRPELKPDPILSNLNLPQVEPAGLERGHAHKIPVFPQEDILRHKKERAEMLEKHARLVRQHPLDQGGRLKSEAGSLVSGVDDRSQSLAPINGTTDDTSGSTPPLSPRLESTEYFFDSPPSSPRP